MVHVKESEEFLEDWVEQKLDEGVGRQRLKKVLRGRDRDPGIVDRVASPFEDDEDVEVTESEDSEVKDEELEEGEESSESSFVSRLLS